MFYNNTIVIKQDYYTKQFDFFITLPGRPHCQASLVSYSTK